MARTAPMAPSTPSGILPIPDWPQDDTPDEYLDNPPGVIGKERSKACIGIHALQLGYRKEGKELCCNHEHKSPVCQASSLPAIPDRPHPFWMDTGPTGVRPQSSCNGCLPLTVHPLRTGKVGRELCPPGYSSVLTSPLDAYLFASGCSTPGALFSAPSVPSTFLSSYAICAF